MIPGALFALPSEGILCGSLAILTWQTRFGPLPARESQIMAMTCFRLDLIRALSAVYKEQP